jgi:hypothetical protein
VTTHPPPRYRPWRCPYCGVLSRVYSTCRDCADLATLTVKVALRIAEDGAFGRAMLAQLLRGEGG